MIFCCCSNCITLQINRIKTWSMFVCVLYVAELRHFRYCYMLFLYFIKLFMARRIDKNVQFCSFCFPSIYLIETNQRDLAVLNKTKTCLCIPCVQLTHVYHLEILVVKHGISLIRFIDSYLNIWCKQNNFFFCCPRYWLVVVVCWFFPSFQIWSLKGKMEYIFFYIPATTAAAIIRMLFLLEVVIPIVYLNTFKWHAKWATNETCQPQ